MYTSSHQQQALEGSAVLEKTLWLVDSIPPNALVLQMPINVFSIESLLIERILEDFQALKRTQPSFDVKFLRRIVKVLKPTTTSR